MPTARATADFLTNAVSKQHLTDAFYTRVEQDGSPITLYPQDIEAFCAIKSSAPNQLYFFLGYPAAFLASAYQETKDDRYLEQAKRLLDFSLQCDESIYKFFFAHKVAWAASIVAAVTKDRKYADLATRIADHLLSLQSENGLFLVDGDPMDKYDQSAEIAQWLTAIAQNLGKIPCSS
jgi:rhamnogalacturonyl hydrolase YesR